MKCVCLIREKACGEFEFDSHKYFGKQFRPRNGHVRNTTKVTNKRIQHKR